MLPVRLLADHSPAAIQQNQVFTTRSVHPPLELIALPNRVVPAFCCPQHSHQFRATQRCICCFRINGRTRLFPLVSCTALRKIPVKREKQGTFPLFCLQIGYIGPSPVDRQAFSTPLTPSLRQGTRNYQENPDTLAGGNKGTSPRSTQAPTANHCGGDVRRRQYSRFA